MTFETLLFDVDTVSEDAPPTMGTLVEYKSPVVPLLVQFADAVFPPAGP